MTKMKFISLIIIAIMMITLTPAYAYDSSNPYTCTIAWSIPSDTSFSASFAGAETQVDFTHSTATENLVEPDSQVASSSIPILKFINDGNVAQNFSCNLTTAKPSWATILVNDVNSNSTADTFDTTAVTFNTSVAAGDQTSMYLWTNISAATLGSTERTLQVNSEQDTS